MNEIFYPWHPGNSSCWNMAILHHNVSSLWLWLAVLYARADRLDRCHTCLAECRKNTSMRNFLLAIANASD